MKTNKRLFEIIAIIMLVALCALALFGCRSKSRITVSEFSVSEINGGIALTVKTSDGNSEEYVLLSGETEVSGAEGGKVQTITRVLVDGDNETYNIIMKDGTQCTFTVLCPSACEHEFTETVTPADCENGGSTTFSCKNCGYSYLGSRSEALGHDYVTENVVSGGEVKTLYTCVRCEDSYMKDIELQNASELIYTSDLEEFSERTLTLAVDSGIGVATSYWTAEYTDDGVSINVIVLDEHISAIHADKGMNDNIEFHIQAANNTKFHPNYTYNVLVNAAGDYWVRKTDGTGFSFIDIAGVRYPNDKIWFETSLIEGGWKAKIFVGYNLLNVSPSKGKGNVRIMPMLRNCDDTVKDVYEHNEYSFYNYMGSDYDWPNTWCVLDEDNNFVRKDLDAFSLVEAQNDMSPSISEVTGNLAELTAAVGELRHTDYGAPCFYNSNYSLDYYGFARELVGTTDFVYAFKGANDKCAKAVVSKAGYVIMMFGVNANTTVMINSFANDGWIALTDEQRNPFGFMAQTNFIDTACYYVKQCEQGEIISVTANWGVIFGKRLEDTPKYSYEETPAYISTDVNDDYYLPENNVFSCGPSIAVTENGRRFVGWHQGGTSEPKEGNCLMFAYSDDGDTWTRAFVVDTWENRIPLSSKKHVVCDYDFQAVEIEGKSVIKVLYTLRLNHDGNTARNCATWSFTLLNPDDPVADWQFSEQKFAFYGVPRNGFLVLSDGRYMAVPNSTVDERYNEVYVSDDNGETWQKISTVYAPQCTNFDETVLVEKLDGALWLTFRSTRGVVMESFSYDGGLTWTLTRKSNIVNPSSRFEIVRLLSGKLMLVHNDHESARTGMTVAISEDDGETWENKLCLYAGNCSYPAAAVLKNGKIYITFDDGRYEAQQVRRSEDGNYKYWGHIYCVELTEEEIMAGGAKEGETPLLMVGDTYAASGSWRAFDQAFGTYGVKTIATANNTLTALSGQLAQIVGEAPEAVFVNAGINELNGGGNGASIAGSVTAFASEILEALPDTTVYLNAAIVNATHYSYKSEYLAFNAALRAFAEVTEGVEYIDVNDLLTLIDGTTDISKFEDGFMLNVHGYAILTDEIYKATGIGISYETLEVVTRLSKYIGAEADFSGRVLDENGLPISGALVTVTVKGKEYTAYSEADGSYLIESVPQDDYETTVSAEGYVSRTLRGTKQSVSGGAMTETVYLVSSATTLGTLGSSDQYAVYAAKTDSGIRFMAFNEDVIPAADKITFYFNAYGFVRSRNAFTFAFPVSLTSAYLRHYSNNNNNLVADGLTQTGIVCESAAHSLVGFLPYANINSFIADSGIDFYTVTKNSPLPISMLLEGSEKAYWQISDIPGEALRSKLTTLATTYKNNAPSGAVEIASVRAMPAILSDGTLGAWSDVADDGFRASVFNAVARAQLNINVDITANMATVTTASGATVETVENGASIFTGTSSVNDADATLSFFSEYTPSWYFGMKYVKKSNTSTATVTAQTSGYVIIHALKSVSVNGFTEIVTLIGTDGAVVKSSWFRPYHVLVKYVEAGETVTVPNTAVLYVGG